jgi:hypothetical protein
MKELEIIQSQLKAPKGQYNTFGKYKYRSCEDILEAVKPLLAEQKCTLTLSDDMVTMGNRVYVKAIATLTNESGEKSITTAFAREEETKKGMDGSQITGAASSYARKYALNGLFCIDDTKDSDATNTGEDKAEPKPLLTQAVKDEIKAAKTKADLASVFNAHKDLQTDKAFVSLLSEKKKEVA